MQFTFDDSGRLSSLRSKESGTEFAVPHFLWRLVCSYGTCQELEITPEGSDTELFFEKDSFRIVSTALKTARGELIDAAVTVSGKLKDDELHLDLSVENRKGSGCFITEAHFPLFALSDNAAHMTLHTSESGGRVWPDLVSYRGRLRNFEAIYQGRHFLFERRLSNYPSHSATLNCFILNSETEGIYFGCHDDSFQFNGHMIEEEKNGPMKLGMFKLPFLAEEKSVSYSHYVISYHKGTWHRGAEKYRKWAETWYQFNEIPEAVRRMQGWQRLIMRSQYGEDNYPFSSMEQICDDGMKAGIDTLLMFAWYKGGQDNGYPDYSVSESLGGKEGLKEGIKKFHAKGGQVFLYSNGQLIDHNSDFYRHGNGPRVTTRDPRGNEHVQRWGYSGPGLYNSIFGGRCFSRACPSSQEFLEILKSYVDLTAEVGADGVFFDQLGTGDQLCCAPDHGHPVPFFTVMKARSDMLAELRRYAKSKGLSVGTEQITDVTSQHVDYIHTAPGGANPENPNWEARGEKPIVLKDFSFYRYVYPEKIVSNREIRDENDMVRRCNYLLVQNLVSDVEVYRCQRTIGALPGYQAYLGKVNAFREKHAALLRGAKFRSDADYSCSSDEFYSAGHRAPDDSLVIMATLSHLDRCEGHFEVPGHRYDSADFLGKGKADDKGNFELERFSSVLLRFLPETKGDQSL